MTFLDVEIGPNYFFVGLLTPDGKHHVFHKPKQKLFRLLAKDTIVTFNGMKYDMPMMAAFAMGKRSQERLYTLSNSLITGNSPWWKLITRAESTFINSIDHIDIREPAPGVMVSLKLYGARLHFKNLQDLPYEHDKALKKKEIKEVERYNLNDLETTEALYNAIKGRIELREKMSNEYGVDLRSKSDAQVAESVISIRLRLERGLKNKVPKRISYVAPAVLHKHIKNNTVLDVLQKIENEGFAINPKNGSPVLPDWLKKTVICIGDTEYNIGIGGLHSKEKKLVVKGKLRNADVASYYPSMILHYEFYPERLGSNFLDLYREIFETRMRAKRTGDKVINESLKIVLNGSFGKLGSRYSILYAPDLMLQVTITGQFLLLMLIDELEENGFTVVSANTDGVEYISHDDTLAKKIISKWEKRSGMTMEHGEYKALYARDVNNYVAVYDDHVKAKGVYAEPTLQKNSEYPIVFEAIRKFLLDGTSMKKTINGCKDVRQFLSMRNVTGGAVWRDKFLGRVVRWYYSVDGDFITYKKNGNRVPKTENAVPMMKLKKKVPSDLDRKAYITLANKHLKELGL